MLSVHNQTHKKITNRQVEEYVDGLEKDRLIVARYLSNYHQKENDSAKKQDEDHKRQHGMTIDEAIERFLPCSLELRMLTAELPYGYEFMANSHRLVITPLTEKVF